MAEVDIEGSLARRAMQLTYTHGEPFVTTHDLTAVDALIDEFYAQPGNEVGGLLHIVLDDSNWRDSSIEYCREEARAENDEAAYWLAQLLLTLSAEERLQLACVCPCCIKDAARDLGVVLSPS